MFPLPPCLWSLKCSNTDSMLKINLKTLSSVPFKKTVCCATWWKIFGAHAVLGLQQPIKPFIKTISCMPVKIPLCATRAWDFRPLRWVMINDICISKNSANSRWYKRDNKLHAVNVETVSPTTSNMHYFLTHEHFFIYCSRPEISNDLKAHIWNYLLSHIFSHKFAQMKLQHHYSYLRIRGKRSGFGCMT